MTTLYDTDFIVKHLPQKLPFLMIDRVIEYKPNRMIKTLKNVTAKEDYFQGHFPEKKIMPGIMICEALAQSVTLFTILNNMEKKEDMKKPSSEEDSSKEGIPVLASINVKFMNIVTPGDQLILQVKPGRMLHEMFAFDVEASVDGRVVTKGTLFTTRKKEKA